MRLPGECSDLLIVIEEVEDTTFQRDGNNVILIFYVSLLLTAALGASDGGCDD